MNFSPLVFFWLYPLAVILAMSAWTSEQQAVVQMRIYKKHRIAFDALCMWLCLGIELLLRATNHPSAAQHLEFLGAGFALFYAATYTGPKLPALWKRLSAYVVAWFWSFDVYGSSESAEWEKDYQAYKKRLEDPYPSFGEPMPWWTCKGCGRKFPTDEKDPYYSWEYCKSTCAEGKEHRNPLDCLEDEVLTLAEATNFNIGSAWVALSRGELDVALEYLLWERDRRARDIIDSETCMSYEAWKKYEFQIRSVMLLEPLSALSLVLAAYLRCQPRYEGVIDGPLHTEEMIKVIEKLLDAKGSEAYTPAFLKAILDDLKREEVKISCGKWEDITDRLGRACSPISIQSCVLSPTTANIASNATYDLEFGTYHSGYRLGKIRTWDQYREGMNDLIVESIRSGLTEHLCAEIPMSVLLGKTDAQIDTEVFPDNPDSIADDGCVSLDIDVKPGEKLMLRVRNTSSEPVTCNLYAYATMFVPDEKGPLVFYDVESKGDTEGGVTKPLYVPGVKYKKDDES